METETMIRQLRSVAKKHENDKLHTFDTNISLMCTDVANRLEELNDTKNKLFRLNDSLDSLIEVTNATYMECDNETEKVRLDGQVRAYWQAKHLVEDILTIKTILA